MTNENDLSYPMVDEAWLNTFSGKRVSLYDPQPEDIEPIDIAHGLSMQCRYNGHIKEFYSVAEHSLVASLMGYGANPFNPGLALAALLHDASEAYLGDIISPLKRHLPGYAEFETKMTQVIYVKFGIEHFIDSSFVHEVDRRMLATEARQLVNKHPDWHVPYEPYRITLTCMDPKEAKYQFMHRFRELVSLNGLRIGGLNVGS